MSSEHNRFRRKWQDYSSQNAAFAEVSFFDQFSNIFNDTEYIIRSRPNDFRNIYVDVQLSEADLDQIYTPPKPVTRHGVFPDYAIDNLNTRKTIYVEVKRQDGWVEGGKRADGRGNAHERSCKYFAPGLLRIMREKGRIPAPNLPFWAVFQGDITRDPCRVREITCWYEGFTENFFFWRQAPNPELLFKHFDEFIAPVLENQES